MGIRIEVLPFLGVAVGVAVLLALATRLCGARGRRAFFAGTIPGLILAAYFLYFFRDPPRLSPADPNAIVAGAEGRVAAITELSSARFREIVRASGVREDSLGNFLSMDVIRISIFLSLFDVHVNRAPIAGTSTFLGYFPGKHLFTFDEKSSDVNQHNSILIVNDRTRCLFNQIVGPVCRRVVYWPDHGKPVAVKKGDPIGMMKFGSRLDMYFPKKDVAVTAKIGDTVRAGETVIARLRAEDRP
jgi:phosphatidylserine decarboxylase